MAAIDQLFVRRVHYTGAFVLCDAEGRVVGAQRQVEIKQSVDEENGMLSRVTVEFLIRTENIQTDKIVPL